MRKFTIPPIRNSEAEHRIPKAEHRLTRENQMEMAENAIQLSGKKLIILGERDGVPAPVIEQAVAGLGGDVAYAATQCFV